MKQLLFILTLLILACSPPSEKHPHGDANEHMHQSSVEELIQHFESPERDAYQKPEKVLDHLGDLDGKTVMDIGAGSGYFSVKLAHRGAQVIAADVDDLFLNHIRQKIRKNKLGNIELRKIPYNDPLLKKEEVDLVLLVNTYHHIEKRADYFAKVRKGIKHAGSLVVVDFFKSDQPVGPPVHHKISMDQMIAELKTAGFSSFHVDVNLLPYQFIVRAQ